MRDEGEEVPTLSDEPDYTEYNIGFLGINNLIMRMFLTVNRTRNFTESGACAIKLTEILACFKINGISDNKLMSHITDIFLHLDSSVLDYYSDLYKKRRANNGK